MVARWKDYGRVVAIVMDPDLKIRVKECELGCAMRQNYDYNDTTMRPTKQNDHLIVFTGGDP
jgi:hypothetical protein